MSAVELRDRAFGVLCGMVMEDGRPWVETAAPYQRTNALAILDPAAEVKQHWLTMPRGARKTTDLAGLLLSLLLTQAPPMARAYVGASDEDQARDLLDAALGLISRTPGLAAAFRVTELEIVALHNGASVTALPADASAMGKRAWFICLDEVANWPDTRRARRFWGTLTSGGRKLADCRLVVITNAGMPSHWAWQRREAARTSSHWRLVEIDGPLPWLTAADVQILTENAETPSEFERLHLNRWVDAEDRLASREDIEACATLPGPLPWAPGRRYVVTVDLATTNDNAVAVVMHREDGRVIVDRLQVWTPTRSRPVPHGEVERWLTDAATEFKAPLHFDPAEMRGMAQRLAAEGIRCEAFTFSSATVGKLGVTLFNIIRARALAIPNDQDLISELVHVRLRRTAPGQYRLDHDAGQHDDRAVAIAIGASVLLDQAGSPARMLCAPEPPVSALDGQPLLHPFGAWAVRPGTLSAAPAAKVLSRKSRYAP